MCGWLGGWTDGDGFGDLGRGMENFINSIFGPPQFGFVTVVTKYVGGCGLVKGPNKKELRVFSYVLQNVTFYSFKI